MEIIHCEINQHQSNTAGYWIYADVIDMSAATVAGTIYCVGAAGTAGTIDTGGAGGVGSTTVRGSSGGAGASTSFLGSVGDGVNGGDGHDSIGFGGRGGSSAAGTYAIGGLGGRSQPFPTGNILVALSSPSIGGGGGGGGCGSHDQDTGYSGGGGGEGSPGIRIVCRSLILPTSPVAGMIKSTGGAGANASENNALASSGGGGGGGGILIAYNTLTNTSATTICQSIGGAGAAYGGDGAGGYGGVCAKINLSTYAITTAGPTANSTTTGGTTSLAI
jgi:hypothetical protein